MKYKVTIHPHTRKGSDNINLFLRISVNGERTELTTGLACRASAYDTKSRSILNAPLDNLKLQETISRCERILLQMSLTNADASLSDFLHIYNNIDKPSKTLISFDDAVDEFISEQSVVKSWSAGTVKKFRVLKNRIGEFRPHAKLNDLDDAWITAFIEHLQKGYTRTRKDGTVVSLSYRNTSLAKILKQFRWFLRWAKNKGLYNGKSENFSIEMKGGGEPLSDIVFLTSDELHLLMDHVWPEGQKHLERVVDVFIFACYCGLRYSDIDALRRYHIHDGQIFISTQKTAHKVAIPLNKVTDGILQKYKDYNDNLGRPFPVISDQRSNEELKEAARICGITSTVNRIWYNGNRKHEETKQKCEVLSFHCARRTFITQALVLGIPDAVLIQLTGHTTTKMLKRYQGVVDSLKQSEISKFDNL